ncbi:MAG: putative metalloprotease with PDZ domain [Planctomycetota bacterium]|jgi:predicted metalloprotease with PDZ domain
MWIRFALALFAVFFAAGAAAQDLEGPQLEYQLRVVPGEVGLVEASAKLTGLDPERSGQLFYMVAGYGFVSLPAPPLSGLPSATDGGGQALKVERLQPHLWRVHKGTASELELTWSVPLTHRSHPLVDGHDEYQFPYLAADHGMLSTSALLMLPRGLDFGTPLLSIEGPEGWPVYGPWPELAPGVFRPTSASALASNLFAVGAWERRETTADGVLIELLFAPGQDPLPDLISALVAPILRAELELFQARPFERFSLLFGRPDMPGLNGSPKHSSMTLSVDPRMRTEDGIGHVVHLLAHEFFHTWGQSRYRFKGELRFFHEGFTDYYAHLLSARLGLTPWSDFGQAIESALIDWESNPLVPRLSLGKAGGPIFFEEPDAKHLVYRGGLALAALVDLALRNPDLRVDGRDTDLDELMRALTNDPRWSKDGRSPGLRALHLLLAQRLGAPRALALISLVRSVGVPDLAHAFEAFGQPLERSTVAYPLNLQATLDGNHLLDLESASLAHKLGLRPGDTVRRINGVSIHGEVDLRRAWAGLGETILLGIRREGELLEWEQKLPLQTRYSLPLDAWKP